MPCNGDRDKSLFGQIWTQSCSDHGFKRPGSTGKIKPRLLADFGQFYTRTVLLGGRHDGLGGGRRGATQGLYKLPFPGQPVQAALKQA